MNLDILNDQQYASDFIITGLPRSRTAWFAAYFSATGNLTAHEPYSLCSTNKDVRAVQRKYKGVSDSFLLFVPTLRSKRVIIERDPEEVKTSLGKLFDTDREVMHDIVYKSYEQMQKSDGLRVRIEDINTRLQEIHEYCVNTPYNPDLAEIFLNLNITVQTLGCTEEFSNLVEELIP